MAGLLLHGTQVRGGSKRQSEPWENLQWISQKKSTTRHTAVRGLSAEALTLGP